MDKHELRIGNLVHNADSNTGMTVEELRYTHAMVKYIRSDTGKEHNSLVEYEFLNPVPLTEDQFLQLGFQEVDIYRDAITYQKGLYVVADNGWFMKSGGGHKFNILNKSIKSVHKLQNIYSELSE